MQKGYRYKLVAPTGRSFDPDFDPDLTPKEMLRLGVFGGKYMTDCRREFPRSWFLRAKLSPRRSDPSLNYFGVSASQRSPNGNERDGYSLATRVVGFNGTADTTWAGVYPRRTRGKSNGGRPLAAMPRKSEKIARPAIFPAADGNARRCCNGPMTAGLCSEPRRVSGSPDEQVFL